MTFFFYRNIIPEAHVGLAVEHTVAILEICNGGKGIARTTLKYFTIRRHVFMNMFIFTILTSLPVPGF